MIAESTSTVSWRITGNRNTPAGSYKRCPSLSSQGGYHLKWLSHLLVTQFSRMRSCVIVVGVLSQFCMTPLRKKALSKIPNQFAKLLFQIQHSGYKPRRLSYKLHGKV